MFSRHAASAVPPGFRSDLLRWRQLVGVDWLAALLAQAMEPGASPIDLVAAPVSGWQLLEVGCADHAAYASGHIPGARFLDTQQFEQAPYWNALAPADLVQLLQGLGLGPASTVILYGRNMLAAARVAQLMLVAGVQDVRLLDGGLAAWSAAGHALQPGPQPGLPSLPARERDPLADTTPWLGRPDYLLNLEQARALRTLPRGALVSIRSHAEWMGETSGYPYIAARGEIAGALWGHARRDGDVNSMSSFQDGAGRMKPAADIQAVWAEAGIHAGMQIGFYCGTGWRASLAFFYAWLMGWPRISVFDGGWMEWSADAANPVVCRSR